MGSENRKRNKMIPIRLTPEEYRNLLEKAGYLEVSVPGFVRDLALNKKINSPLISRSDSVRVLEKLIDIDINLERLCKLIYLESLNVIDLTETKDILSQLIQLHKELRETNK